MGFEWNHQKKEINSQKHGVTFDEASTVFRDALSVTFPDVEHSIQGGTLSYHWAFQKK